MAGAWISLEEERREPSDDRATPGTGVGATGGCTWEEAPLERSRDTRLLVPAEGSREPFFSTTLEGAAIGLGAAIPFRSTSRDPGRELSRLAGARLEPPGSLPRFPAAARVVAGEGSGATCGRYTARLLPSLANRSPRPLGDLPGSSRSVTRRTSE